jgi:hypothetical protein
LTNDKIACFNDRGQNLLESIMKKQTIAPPGTIDKPFNYHIESCSVSNIVPATNEHTRAAVVAMAKAVEANANALAKMAEALRGGNAIMDCGIRAGG